jgi:hypothetical protein
MYENTVSRPYLPCVFTSEGIDSFLSTHRNKMLGNRARETSHSNCQKGACSVSRQRSESRLTVSDWSDPDERIWPWISLIVLFFVGVPIAIPTRPKFLFLVTSPMWLCAWVVVLAHNYKKKLPIPAFGRLVNMKSGPFSTNCCL